MLILFFLCVVLTEFPTTYTHNRYFGVYQDMVTLGPIDAAASSALTFVKYYQQTYFSNPPNIFLYINSIFNPLELDSCFRMRYSLRQVTSTGYSILLEDQKYTAQRLISVKLGIVYWQELLFPSIKIFQTHSLYFEALNVVTGNISTGLHLTSAYTQCFLQKLHSDFYGAIQMKLSLSCEKSQTVIDQITYQFKTPSSVYNWDIVFLYLIIEDDYLQINVGHIESTDWTVGASVPNVDLSSQQHLFLLGLSGFGVLNSQILDAAISNSGVSLQITSQYIFLNYRYIYIFMQHPKIELLNITTSQKPKMVNITYKNSIDHQLIDLSNITLDPTTLIPQQIVVENGMFIVVCKYYGWLEENDFDIKLKWINHKGTYWTATTSFNFTQLIPCIEDSPEFFRKANTISQFLYYFQFAYLGVFALSLISSKTIGIQMMISAQLAYNSLIQVQSYYFKMLGQMKFFNGFNPLFESLSQNQVPKQYSQLGYKSNFLSNVNLSVFLLPISLVISLLLFVCYYFSNHYQIKPIFKKYSISFAYEWPFTILLFSFFNITISLIIHLKVVSRPTQLQLAIGFILLLLPIILSVIYFYINTHLSQFREQLNKKYKVKPFTIQTSRLICQSYPILLVVQLYLYSILIGFQVSLYSICLCLAVSILVEAFCLWTVPFVQKSNNVRLIIHKSIDILLLIAVLIGKIYTTDSYKCYETLSYLFLPCFMIICLSCICVSSLSLIMLRLIRWFKKKTPIDASLLKLSFAITKPSDNTSTKSKSFMKQSMFSLSKEQNLQMKKDNKTKLEILEILSQFRAETSRGNYNQQHESL